MSRTSGITIELTATATSKAPWKSSSSCIGRVRKVTFCSASSPEPLPGLGDHPRGEVERDDPAEAVDQVRQERPGPAAEVGDGLRARVGDGEDRVEQRVLDPGSERVEEQVVIPGRGAAPVAVLAFGVGHGCGVASSQ